jgi:hypothetical protein
VGIGSAFRLNRAAAALDPRSGVTDRGVIAPYGSPHPGHLETIVWADLVPAGVQLPVTRAEAMTVPAVVRARHLIVQALAGLPLRALRGADVLPDADQPAFLYRTDGIVSPWHRHSMTFDDLLFYGWSLWAVDRGAEDRILAADRVPYDDWTFDQDGNVVVDGQVVDAASVILFPGPAEGLLSYGARTIRAARGTEDAWQGRIRNPIPATELHQVTDDVLERDEIRDLVDTYCRARMDVNGAVVYTPNGIELRTHGESTADVLVEGRNAVRIDVANLTGLPAMALDGSLATASLTYVTQEGKFSELGEALRLWADPFTARLSQDDVVPRGQRVRFDTAEQLAPTPTPTGATVAD